jgi:3-hydroxyisobutyrate dehydrogenase-like beta-hydroxyacid dehydrogenase
MTTLGFVGLGHMGGNMAARFLAAGYTVFGESRDRRDADELVHGGLQWRSTPHEIAEAADVLITSVPNDASAWVRSARRCSTLRSRQAFPKCKQEP